MQSFRLIAALVAGSLLLPVVATRADAAEGGSSAGRHSRRIGPRDTTSKISGHARDAFSALDELDERQTAGQTELDQAPRPPANKKITSAGISLDQQRSDLKDLLSQLSAAANERRSLAARLDSLNAQIEQQKNSIMGGRLGARTGAVSDELLRESQSVSEQLSHKVVEEQTLTEKVQESRGRLTLSVDAEIRHLYANWDKTPRHKLRSVLVPALRQLYQERKVLLSEQFAHQNNEAAIPAISNQSSGDPDALLEMADMLLDREDKLRREEKAVARHIEQLRNEQELERRLAALVEEDALFDEGERRISLSRSAHITVADKSATAPLAIEPQANFSASDIGKSSIGPVPVSAENASPDAGGSAAVPSPASGTSNRQSAMAAAERSDMDTLSSGGTAPKPFLGNWAESDSIQTLKAHQAYLRSQADELHRRAEEAIRQAGELQ